MAAGHAKAKVAAAAIRGGSLDTEVITIDPVRPDAATLRRAAAVIRGGGLVAFPTETVYGLGAHALDAAAVARIFEAKGRPPTNPIIVHVSDTEQARSLAAEWPPAAVALAERFWPGPLTIVVRKQPDVPDIVTAGGPTVAVRCPAHPVARMLIREAGVPIAAPSANRSTEISPTRAEHVLKGLSGRIDLVLDGGPCPGGIESTVVDATGDIVRVLRPGLITEPMLKAVVGQVETSPRREPPGEPARAPGQMARHYSPRTPLVLADSLAATVVKLARLAEGGRRNGVVTLDRLLDIDRPTRSHTMPRDPDRYAASLYSVLHDLDEAGLDVIVVQLPPDTPEWAAVRDRLHRAAQR